MNILLKYTFEPITINIIITAILIVAAIVVPIIIIYSIWQIHKEIHTVAIAIQQQNEILNKLIDSNTKQ